VARRPGAIAPVGAASFYLCAMSSDIVFRSAIELCAALRSRELSAREVTEAHLEQIERVNPAVNAVVTWWRARPGRGRRADARIASAPSRGAARVADPAQGHSRDRRRPHHARLARVRGQRAGPGRADRRARTGAGAISLGKTNRRVRGRSHTFNQVFGQRTTVRPVALTRRFERRSRAALACGWHRSRMAVNGWIAAQPGLVLQRRGLRPSPGRVRPGRPSRLVDVSVQVDGAHGRRRRAAAVGHRRPTDRSPIALGDPGSTFAGAGAGSRRSAYRMVARSRWIVAVDAEVAASWRHRRRIRKPRLHRRGGLHRLRRRRRGVPDAAGHPVRGQPGGLRDTSPIC